MANFDIGGLGAITSVDDVVDALAKLQKQLEYMMDGNLGSKNIREVGDYLVGANDFVSRSGTVGISSLVTGGDDLRFWAGSATRASAPFRVYESGDVHVANLLCSGGTVTGATIQNQAAAGNRVWMDSEGLHANDSAGIERIECTNTTVKGGKAWYFYGTVGPTGDKSLITYDTETVDGASRTGIYIVGPDAQYLLFDTSNGVRIQNGPQSTNEGFRALPLSRPEIQDGGGWAGIAKKSEVDVKANGSGVNGTFYVASTSGGSPTTQVTVSNGVITGIV